MRPLTSNIAEVADGPNQGWSYLAGDDPPIAFDEFRIFLNEILFDSRDSFWKRRTDCSQGQVAAVRSVVRQHERVHVDRFLRLLPTTPINALVEDVAAFGTRDALTEKAVDRAIAIADTADWMTDKNHTHESYPSAPCQLNLRANP